MWPSLGIQSGFTGTPKDLPVSRCFFWINFVSSLSNSFSSTRCWAPALIRRLLLIQEGSDTSSRRLATTGHQLKITLFFNQVSEVTCFVDALVDRQLIARATMSSKQTSIAMPERERYRCEAPRSFEPYAICIRRDVQSLSSRLAS